MKKTTILLTMITFLLCSVLFVNSQATIWTVNVQNFSFNPVNLPDVKVGDTVRWIWISGSHTTTSTTIPGGAATWDQPINIEFQQFDYIPTVTGTYNYWCTPHAPGMAGSFTVGTAVGITDLETAPDMLVSPNPFKNNFTIGFASNTESWVKEIKVFDINGKIVYSSESQPIETTEQKTIMLSNLQAGTYFLLVTDQTNKIYRNKLIKE